MIVHKLSSFTLVYRNVVLEFTKFEFSQIYTPERGRDKCGDVVRESQLSREIARTEK